MYFTCHLLVILENTGSLTKKPLHSPCPLCTSHIAIDKIEMILRSIFQLYNAHHYAFASWHFVTPLLLGQCHYQTLYLNSLISLFSSRIPYNCLWAGLYSCQEVDEWYAGKLFLFTAIFVTVLFSQHFCKVCLLNFHGVVLALKNATAIRCYAKRNMFYVIKCNPSIFLCSCLCWCMRTASWTQVPSFL